MAKRTQHDLQVHLIKRYGRAVPKAKYKAMLRHARFLLKQYMEHPGPFDFSPKMFFSLARLRVGDRVESVSDREVELAWPHIVKELCLIPAGYGPDLWTVSGRKVDPEEMAKQVTEQLQKMKE